MNVLWISSWWVWQYQQPVGEIMYCHKAFLPGLNLMSHLCCWCVPSTLWTMKGLSSSQHLTISDLCPTRCQVHWGNKFNYFCILAPSPCSGTWQMLSKYLPIHSCRIQQNNHLMLREVACRHSMLVTKPVLCLGLCPFYYIISIIVWLHMCGLEGYLKAVTSSPYPTGHHTQQSPWGQGSALC